MDRLKSQLLLAYLDDILISGDGQTLGKLHYDHYENALAMVKGAKEVILFDPRNNHQLYATQLQQAQFEVTKNNGSYELVPRGLQERNCIVIISIYQ